MRGLVPERQELILLRAWLCAVVALVGCSSWAPVDGADDVEGDSGAGAAGLPTPDAAPAPRTSGPDRAEEARLPDRPLVFGRPPHLVDTATEFTPLAEHLGAAIGHPIVVKVPASYDEVVDLLVAGQIDVAQLTPFTYVKARERLPGLRLLATILGEGSTRYRGYVVTRLGGGIDELGDLRGKRFAFVDRASTSGYLFPLALFRQAGIEPDRDFAAVTFEGNHPGVVHAVLEGKVDGGAISSTTFSHLRGELLNGKVQIIGKTDWIPFDAMVVHPSIPEQVAQKLQETLIQLNMRTPEGRAVLRGVTTTNGFVIGDDHLYDPVRAVAAHVGTGTDPSH